MKIIITGASGFFGRYLVQYLEEQGHTLVLIDREPPAPWTHTYLQHDLDQGLDIVEKHFEGADVCVHLANRARIEPSWTNYPSYYSTNITGSQRLFELCQSKGLQKFFYFSSSSVYGNNGTLVQSEGSPLCPTNPYAVSKAAAEMALGVQSCKGNTQLIIVRPFTMYGDNMDSTRDKGIIIGRYLGAVAEGHPLEIQGSGTQERDFIHVWDAVHAFGLIMENGIQGDVYNIGTGISVSVQDIANAVSDLQVTVPDRPGQVSITRADITKLKELGFNPTINVITWLKNSVKEIKLKNCK